MKLSEAVKRNDMDRLTQKIQSYSWDNGVCPTCAAEDVEMIGCNENLGEGRYKCLVCGTKGRGLCVGDAPPTSMQIRRYEEVHKYERGYAGVVPNPNYKPRVSLIHRLVLLFTRNCA